MNNCVFCKEGTDFSYAKSFLGNKWPFQNRVVYSDKHLFAVVGYGPQVCPYVLIIPYRHILSLAQMNNNEKKSFLKCLQFLSSCGAYGESIHFFEHGGSSKDGSSSVDHCHVHIIDSKFMFFDYPSFSDFKNIENISELQSFSSAYYLIGEYSGGILKMKAQEDTRNEHQYLRKVLAEILGEKQWDWKADMKFDVMVNAMNAFCKT